MEAFEAGKLKQAMAHCDKALQVNPQHAELLHLSATIAEQLHQYEAALGYVQRALKQAPEASAFHNTRGLIQAGLGQKEEAETAYRLALQFDPTNALAHHNLGEILFAREETEAARQAYQEALRYYPDHAETHGNLGFLLLHQHENETASRHLARAIELAPKKVAFHHNLAHALQALNQHQEALTVLGRALQLKPDFAEAWHDMGVSLLALRKSAEGIAAMEKAAQLKPDLDLAYLNIGSHYDEAGLVDVARQYFQRAYDVRPSAGARMRLALSFPAFYESIAQLNTEYERLDAALEQVEADPLPLNNPLDEVAITPFYLAYGGQNELSRLRRIGDLFARDCQSLNFTAPHCQRPRRSDEPLKIGFISSCFAQPRHIINRFVGGIIANWPRDHWQITLLHPKQASAELLQYLRPEDRCVPIASALEPARRQIADEQLDILFFPDLGMEPWTYYLAYSRLARVQLTTGGHPITTGIPNVDYFLSSAIEEVPHAQQHYREQVLLLPQRPVSYAPLEVPVMHKTKSDFGVPDNRHIYLCPMTPFKLHPEMDSLFGEILRADSDGEVVLITNHQTEFWERLKQRLARTIPDVAARVRFLPRLSAADFVAMLRVSEVLLDTTQFGGGTTSLEALAVGTPIVTWPGELLRQRPTYGMYRCMDWFECVALDANEYVQLATDIARRPDYRLHLQQEILARNSVLFHQTDWISSLSEMLGERATAAHE